MEARAPAPDLGMGAAASAGVAGGGAGAEVALWRRAAHAEASARRLLQAAMAEFYGASADATWLRTQGVAVDDLLGDESDDAAAGGKEGVTVAAGGVCSEPNGDGEGEAGDSEGVQQEKNAGILGRLFGM